MTLSILGASMELSLIVLWLVFWGVVALIAYRLHRAGDEHEQWRGR